MKAEETGAEIKNEEGGENIRKPPHHGTVLEILLETKESKLVTMAKSGHFD